MLTLSTFEGPTDNHPRHVEIDDLHTLAAAMPHELRASKLHHLWSPAQYLDGRLRAKDAVFRVHLLVFDVDDAQALGLPKHSAVDVETLAALVEHLDTQGLERWVYSTFSHTPDACKVRIVLPLSRPVLGAEWPAFLAQAISELCPLHDPAAKDASRMYYPPSAPEGTDPATLIHDYAPGALVDVDAMLARALLSPTSPKPPRVAPDASPEPGAPLVVTDRMRDASSKRLDSLTRRIRTFPQGSGIYAIIRDVAFEIGGRVAAGALSIETARGELRAAHRHRNPNPERVREKDALIEKCLAEGASRPWCPNGWFDTSDKGLAGEMVENHGKHIRYVETWSKWLGWNGTSWSEGSAEKALGLAATSLTDAMRSEAEYASEAREKALRSAVRNVSSASGYRNLIFMSRIEPKVRISHSDLDRDPWILATPRGVVDLRTGHTHEHDSARLTMGCALAHPDANHPAPIWFGFLNELTGGDRDLVRFLQIAMGYSLTGIVEPHALFLLTGTGANGKGAFIRAIKGALGTYAISASPHLLLQKKNEQHATGVADLHRKRIATISEVEEGKGWDEVELKALVDSDNIRARRMREDSWEFEPTHHFWVSGNYMPHVRGVDNGVWRRLFLIPCQTSKIDLEDLELKAKMDAEAPRILAWAIEGCLAWQRQGRRLIPTASMAEAKAAYRHESDPVAQFVEERCERGDASDPAFVTPFAQIYQVYVTWSAQRGHGIGGPPSAQFLGRRLSRFATSRRGAQGVMQWAGIRMRNAATGTFAGVN
jgi:putative DNA primase/helicase